ncbi:LysR family transcriptional regulator [Anaerospora sp.]|uniref:LysR family transcriptional regulator n=1 Tax=Anaerospora sp. TaxID=1960278 RepID=UPI00289C3491|nr:LysR family transcriptional regulator [Anaerospora sp.]
MEFRQLQTFVAITQAGTFALAAEQLGYTQPTLTTHIQALEKELNVKLFDRLGHRIRLTRDGEQFLGYAERILKLSQEAASSVSQSSCCVKLIIGASETFSVLRLPALLKEFRQNYPSVALELQFGDITKFRDDLKNNTIDLAFVLAGKNTYSDLTSEVLCPEPMSFIVSPDHYLARQSTFKLADVATEDFIVTQSGCAYRDYIEKLLAHNNIHPRSFMKVKNIEAIKQFVISGLGVAILPSIYIEKELASSQLAELPWSGPDFGMVTQIIYHKDKWLSPVVLSFLEVTRTKFLAVK